MRKTFQIAALLVVALLSACSGGEEKKERNTGRGCAAE